MSNMSYCRFENTKKDIDDCIEALRNREISSDTEKRNAVLMVYSILEFCQDEGIIEDFNEDVLQEVVDDCE